MNKFIEVFKYVLNADIFVLCVVQVAQGIRNKGSIGKKNKYLGMRFLFMVKGNT